MTSFTFCVLENGRLPEGIRETLKNFFLVFAGKKIRMSIAEAKEKRSLDQNAYYWAVIVPHIRKYRAEQGDPVSEDEVHEDLLMEFAPRVDGRTIGNGLYYKRPMRSKAMSVKEMADYLTVIIARMAEFDPIPLSELQWKETA